MSEGKERCISKITKSMYIPGDIVDTDGNDIEIEGKVKGNIKTSGKVNVTGEVEGYIEAGAIYASGAAIRGNLISDTDIKVGSNTVIIGDVSASSVAVAGAIKGNLDVKNTIVISDTGIVLGNIKSGGLEIAAGAAVEGTITLDYAETPPTLFFEEFEK